MKVVYICDKKVCGENHDCDSSKCGYTSKIEHAVNFAKICDGHYIECFPKEDAERFNPIESSNFEYEVTKYPMFDRAVVSFELPYHGWKTLEKSHFWKSALKYLSEIQKGQNQSLSQDLKG